MLRFILILILIVIRRRGNRTISKAVLVLGLLCAWRGRGVKFSKLRLCEGRDGQGGANGYGTRVKQQKLKTKKKQGAGLSKVIDNFVLAIKPSVF